MDLLQIRYFVAVAKHLSFTKAAKNLFTTQPTVSKQIASLEKELDVQLFIRSKQFVLLTPAGEIMYKEFREILKKIDLTLENVKNESHKLEGKLHLGLHGLLDINRLIPNFFKSFTAEFSNIDLVINSYSFKELRENLLNGNLDLIFTYFFEQAGNDMIQRIPLSRSNSKVYFSSQLPIASKEKLSLTDFRDECFIMLHDDESPLSGAYIKSLCKKYGFIPKKTILANTLENTLFYLESGLGVAVLGSSFRIGPSDKISSLEINDKDFMVGTDAIWRKDNQNPTLNIFVKKLSSYLKSPLGITH
ncbi:MAG: hypothetical protein PWQ68_597 [Thermoanaerobacteraceae bacterium]|jgi:DNA-binding transcriptional LysR family regulator|nr:hypothetical protein [Thermoanaerobacteraceae bacterium]